MQLKSLCYFAPLLLLATHDAMAQRAHDPMRGRAAYEAMVTTHAQANGVPEALVHRVIVRESGYRPGLVSHGNIGLMQIKLATARGVGYTGTAAGLHDPETNLTYAVRYLAGAYRAAHGDFDRAVRYYAAGYYYVAKRQRQHRQRELAGIPAQLPGAPLRLTPLP
jgi:soluble lytic murein transglycosylase-like protein